jgi:protein ImuA
MERRSRAQLMEELKEKLRLLEKPPTAGQGKDVCSTGLEALDRLFPQGGLVPGSLIEWLSESVGSGAATLALILARQLQRQGGLLVVIDAERTFCPLSAEAFGTPLHQTMVIQTSGARDLLWAWEQVLRSTAVAVVMGRLEKIPDRAYRRLQLGAEAGGTVGFLLRPESCRAEPAWAEARFLVEALPSGGPKSRLARRLRIELLRARGGCSGGSIELELNDEESAVPLVSLVAHPASAAREAGA